MKLTEKTWNLSYHKPDWIYFTHSVSNERNTTEIMFSMSQNFYICQDVRAPGSQ